MHLDAPARRITTWLAVFGYALVASGLPLPMGGGFPHGGRAAAAGGRLAAKDRSRPFPCMDKPCGCDTAERCFTSCCCHAPAETLAWARAHGVEVGVLAALERRVSGDAPAGAPAAAAPTGQKSSCCSAAVPRAEPVCCSTDSNATGSTGLPGAAPPRDRQSLAAATCATTDALSAKASAIEKERPGDDASSRRSRSRAVTLRAMLACGGIVAEWFAAGSALPPPRPEVFLVTGILEMRMPADEVGESLRASPDAPPPRAA